MAQNYAVLADEFVKAYYDFYDNPAKRVGLEQLYHNDALQSFEGDQRIGKAQILEKIQSLPFTSVAHKTTKVDSQPTHDGGVLICVLGQLKTDQIGWMFRPIRVIVGCTFQKVDDDPPMGFSQTFILRSFENNWFIMHEVFRLVLHDF